MYICTCVYMRAWIFINYYRWIKRHAAHVRPPPAACRLPLTASCQCAYTCIYLCTFAFGWAQGVTLLVGALIALSVRIFATSYEQTHTHLHIYTHMSTYIYTYLLYSFVSAKAAASVDCFYLSSQLLTFPISCSFFFFFCFSKALASTSPYAVHAPYYSVLHTPPSISPFIPSFSIRALHTYIQMYVWQRVFLLLCYVCISVLYSEAVTALHMQLQLQMYKL